MTTSRDRTAARRDEDEIGDPLRDVDGLTIDPFAAAGGLSEDPIALGEKVAFRLWSDGDVSGRAIEQARKDAGGVGRIDQVLVRQGLVDAEAAARALADEIGAPFATLDAVPARPVMADSLPIKFVTEAAALPLSDDGQTLRLALSNPLDDFTLRAIAMKTRRRLEVFVASDEAIREAITQIYRGAPAASSREDRAPEQPRGLFGAAPAPLEREESTLDDATFDEPAPERAPREEPTRRRAFAFDDAVHDPEWDAPDETPRREDWAQDDGIQDDGIQDDWSQDDWSKDDWSKDARNDDVWPQDASLQDASLQDAWSQDAGPQDAPDEPRPLARRSARDDVWRDEAVDDETSAPRRRILEASRRDEDWRDEAAPAFERPETSNRTETARRDARAASRRPAEPETTPEPPRMRGVVAPTAPTDRPAAEIGDIAAKMVAARTTRPTESTMLLTETHRAKPAADAVDAVRPKFVRPKRVTLKDRTNMPIRGRAAAAGRLGREPQAELDPLAIPPMEGDDSGDVSRSGVDEPARKRFMRGFVGGFMGAESASEPSPDASLSRGAARRRARSAAQKLVAADVRAAVRAEADPAHEEPSGREDRRISFGGFTQRDDAPAAPREETPQAPDIMREAAAAAPDAEPASEQINAAVYQAAAALAQRERRRERAKNAAEARREQGSVVKHQLTTKLVDAPKRPGHKQGSVVADLEALGYRDGAREALEEAVVGGEGLVLICGPSGAGKTGTAAALANRAAGEERKIERFDRPAEERETDAPDAELVLIGAVHDAEGAEAAARAAMRGALVIATLDVESVASAAPRLISMGLPPFALASCLRAVAAQHQAPRSCARCAGSGRAVGGGECAQCNGTGVDGEVNIVEVMGLDDALRALILAQAPEESFRHAMAAKGMPTLADDAAAKIAAGLTNADGAAAATAAARI